MGVRSAPRAARIAALAMGVAFLQACGDGGPTDPSRELSLSVVGGDAQGGLPGWPLGRSLIVEVVDAGGTPVASERVRFEVVEGGGTVDGGSADSGPDGRAATSWTLGPDRAAPQRVRATVEGGGASVDFTARFLGPDEAERLVVRGAEGPLRGFVVFRQGESSVEVTATVSTTDTVIELPRMDPDQWLVVFGTANRPRLVTTLWTPGPDTVVATLEASVAVDLDVRVETGDFEQQKAVMERQIEAADGIWRSEGMGIRVGTVTWTDRTQPPRDVPVSSTGLCATGNARGAVEIHMVSTIDGGSYTGWGCWSGRLYLALGTDNYPNLLAHELGHTFTLEHTATGMMYPSNPGASVHDGEIFRAHFHTASTLNHMFGSEPEADRRTCTPGIRSFCLPEDLDLPAFGVRVAAPVAAPVTLEAREGRTSAAPVDGPTTGR